ncbi:unnamed protein product [Caretta caretta]
MRVYRRPPLLLRCCWRQRCLQNWAAGEQRLWAGIDCLRKGSLAVMPTSCSHVGQPASPPHQDFSIYNAK